MGVAERLADTGALLGDGSIKGTPLNGYSMRMLSSGPAGERVRDMLVPWGMQIEFVGEKLGTASGIKILRSVLIKGIEALTDEMLLAARQYGLDEIVLASASKTLARPWMDTVESLTPSGVIHAKRRAEELEMSAEAVAGRRHRAADGARHRGASALEGGARPQGAFQRRRASQLTRRLSMLSR